MIITEFDKEPWQLDTRDANDNDSRFSNESAVNGITKCAFFQSPSCTQLACLRYKYY